MQIACPKCGARNWLENEKQCHICQTVLRRCIDCANFSRAANTCKTLGIDLTLSQASNPTLLSTSTTCRGYVNVAARQQPQPSA
jgi:hypothetical protein